MWVICSAVRAAEDLPAEKLVVQAAVHRLAHGMEFGFGSLWVITRKSVTLVRVEPKTNEIKEIWLHRINTPQTVAIVSCRLGHGCKKENDFRDRPN